MRGISIIGGGPSVLVGWGVSIGGGVHAPRLSERIANALNVSAANFFSDRCSRILCDDFINDAVRFCFLGAHEVVAVGVFVDTIDRLAGVPS